MTDRHDPAGPNPDSVRPALSVEPDDVPSTVPDGYRIVPLTREVLLDTTVVRAAAGVVIGLLVLAWPTRTNAVLGVLVGVGFVVYSTLSLIDGIRRGRPRADLVLSGAGAALGLLLMLDIGNAHSNVGRLAGVGLVGMAIHQLTRRRGAPKRETIAVAGAFAALGALTFAFPSQVIATSTSLVAALWVVIGVIAIVTTLDARRPGTVGYTGAVEAIGSWLEAQSATIDHRDELADRLTYAGVGAQSRVVRYLLLMTFAAAIASGGIIADSTAVVIGAMLIAPLMTPLMGMAMSLGMGWPNRLARAAGIAGAGILLAIAIGLVLGWTAPVVIDTAVNTQITSRIEPNVLDLIIAVAAGGAGAYGLSRPDVSDALPGVAIAISLVPPLAVSGIGISQGDATAASGALLLFGTNAVAILLVGGFTFVVTGVVPTYRVAEGQRRVTTSLAAVIALAAMVVGALLLNGQQAATDLVNRSTLETTVDEWLDDSGPRVLSITNDRNHVDVDLVGELDDVPDVDDLAADLTEALGRDTTVDVRIRLETTLSGG
ncbi:putative hydrophobic protein (TIGR00271 family) [Ilumatobacter fluminis]|uniref:Putative hydrophobic protein (TIGR00271 family) n=1 Tax=Ilumatobacter fluminis TaxID=467091 RepID=A0A4R7HWT5_9ACTN|nr:DUF389 domain-containing protein [Ilumatobacter fluminis]TDT15587.1 putative hydrophobic protein (TIGR00271 family) [Ilumatobacter fluminis]